MDKAASVLAKLKNKAKVTGKPLQLHLQLFCQEEFLRRLSMSKYADNLVLKGGLFIYTLTNFESRSTTDIDFMARHLPNNVETFQKIVSEIIAVDTGNDFIELTAEAFENISIQRKYPGISCQIIGKIKNTKTPFGIDIGVGDVIVPKPEKREIPVQLDDFTKPEISTYSLESTIAEKFDAILQRLEMTSRMKDFYDIFYLSNMFDFDGRRLQQAIFETLQNRGTPYHADSLEQISRFTADSGMQLKWNQFLKRMNVKEPAFDETINGLITFLAPVWQAIVTEAEFHNSWNKDSGEWA